MFIKTKLSVGCGNRQLPQDYLRLDISPSVNPDIVWNLDKFPYPLPDDQFEEIECLDVIEHVAEIGPTLEEFHRILRPGGILRMTTPHFSCSNSFTDPTHRHHLGYFSFDYFSDQHSLSYYSDARFQIRTRHLQFQGGRFRRSVVSRIANAYPSYYERFWTWILPAWFLHFELEAVKSSRPQQ